MRHIALILAFLAPVGAFADLPNTQTQSQSSYNYNQPWQSNGSGYGYGANYYNTQQYPPATAPKYTSSTTSDLLWLFTGSDDSFSDQVHSGFKSNSQTTFWNRLWNTLLGVAYQRVAVPVIAPILGSLEQSAVSMVTGSKSSGAAYCYECMQQNSTNPYTTNQNSLAPVFGGGTPTSSGSAGNIRY